MISLWNLLRRDRRLRNYRLKQWTVFPIPELMEEGWRSLSVAEEEAIGWKKTPVKLKGL
jgi:hypothetical protein